jgi:hypothetical protein
MGKIGDLAPGWVWHRGGMIVAVTGCFKEETFVFYFSRCPNDHLQFFLHHCAAWPCANLGKIGSDKRTGYLGTAAQPRTGVSTNKNAAETIRQIRGSFYTSFHQS